MCLTVCGNQTREDPHLKMCYVSLLEGFFLVFFLATQTFDQCRYFFLSENCLEDVTLNHLRRNLDSTLSMALGCDVETCPGCDFRFHERFF